MIDRNVKAKDLADYMAPDSKWDWSDGDAAARAETVARILKLDEIGQELLERWELSSNSRPMVSVEDLLHMIYGPCWREQVAKEHYEQYKRDEPENVSQDVLKALGDLSIMVGKLMSRVDLLEKDRR